MEVLMAEMTMISNFFKLKYLCLNQRNKILFKKMKEKFC